MSIISVAQDLYTIQSRKNVSFKSAASILLREELAARFSVYNIVKIVTKSTLLATIAQAKYGKGTPEQIKQQEQEKEEKRKSVLFQRYTLSSIANLNRRVGLLSSIVNRNNQLIANLYNELGSYRTSRRMTAQMLSSPRAVQIPIKKSVKGKLEDLSAEIAELKKIKKVKRVYTPKAPKKEQAKEIGDSGLFSKLIPILLSNPRLAMMLMGGTGTAIGLGTYAAQIASVAGVLGGTGDRVKRRLEGETGYENPLSEQLGQFVDPLLMGTAGYTLIRGGLGATSIGYNIKERLEAKKLEKRLTARYVSGKGRATDIVNTTGPKSIAGRAQKIVRRKALKTSQLAKWKQLSPLLRGAAKRLPALAAADVLYEISKMSGYISDNSNGIMNDAEFKENMTNSYAELISTVGIGGLSTALGGIAGTMIGGPLGTIAGLVGGGIVGAIASIAVDEDDLKGIASKVFDLIHKEKAPNAAVTVGGAERSTDRVDSSGRRDRSRVGSREEIPALNAEAVQQISAPPVLRTSSKNLLEYVGDLESNGNYNAVNYTATAIGYPKSMDLTNKTLAEIFALQTQMVKNGAKSSALGKYQFIQKTLKEEAGAMGLDFTRTKFDPVTQDRIIEHRLKRFRGMDDYYNGKISARQFVKNLSMEFASIPDPDTGVSHYRGVAGNRSLVAVNNVYKVIGAQEGGMVSTIRVAAATPPLTVGERSVERPPVAAATAPPPVAKTEDTNTAVEAKAAAMAVAQLSSTLTGIGGKVQQLEKMSSSNESYYIENPDSSLSPYMNA